MREIKFRVWDNVTDEMYGVEQLQFDRDGHLSGLVADKGLEWGNVLDPTRFEIMQYTGLKDRNGHEIYEGDIVQWDTTNGVYRQEVQYDSDQAMFLPNNMKGEVLVIGNVWENPEKLKMGVQEEKRRFIQSEDRGH